MEQKPDVFKKFFTFVDNRMLVTVLNVHHIVHFIPCGAAAQRGPWPTHS